MENVVQPYTPESEGFLENCSLFFLVSLARLWMGILLVVPLILSSIGAAVGYLFTLFLQPFKEDENVAAGILIIRMILIFPPTRLIQCLKD